ncbi:MAG: hypothetical protein OXD36_01770, partial [Rhodobacter sp.]|nr:hypothetical protein [Rhodobacter sp.]
LDALRLERTETENYRCAWYPSLCEATLAMLSGDDKQRFNRRHRAYRNTIGHSKPGMKMEMGEFRWLQRDAMELLRDLLPS